MNSGDAIDGTMNPKLPLSLDQGESPFAATSPLTLVYTIALVAIALICNAVGTVFFWHMSDDAEVILCLSIGAILAQPCLLAVWLALGSQQVVLRIPLAAGTLLGLVMGYLQTLNILDPGNLPMEVAIFFFSIAAAIFVVVQVPFWIFRSATHQVVARINESNNATASQFSIRHLMITMTIAAVIVLIVKNVIPSGSWEGGAPWKQMIRFVTPYIVVICVLALLNTALIFSQSNRRLLALAIGGIVLIAAVGLYSMSWNGPFTGVGISPGRFIRNASLFFVGFSATMIGVLNAYYRIGFRLRKV